MMIYRRWDRRHCCEGEQAPADIGSADAAGSRATGTGALVLFKLVCCGGPLLVLAVASGAVALSSILAGAGGLALAAGAFLLLRPLARRRAEALPRTQGS